MKYSNQAFTLLDLIVVIIILTILGTIAFVGIQGYSKDSRNAVRTLDINLIKTGLELFSVGKGVYPMPSDLENIVMGSVILGYKGTFGDSVFNQVDNLGQKSVDPMTDVDYGYSIVESGKEFQLKYELEESVLSIVPKTYAVTNLVSRIDGNYNELFSVGNNGEYFTLPSLFPLNPNLTFSEFFMLNGEKEARKFTVQSLGSNLKNNYTGFTEKIQSAYSGSVFTSRGGMYLTLSKLNKTDTESMDKFAKLLLNGELEIILNEFNCESNQSWNGIECILIDSCPNDATSMRGENNSYFTCYCSSASTTAGSIRGTVIYTDDSIICKAAVHNGIITSSGGLVTYEIRPGLNIYPSITNNGIKSLSWGQWIGSYVFR